MTRLSEHLPSQTMTSLEGKIASWRNDPTPFNRMAIVDAITEAATEYSIVSEVTVMTIPHPGAMVKYQTEGQRNRKEQPITANGITELTIIMPIGRYHIWAERDGKPTTNREEIRRILNKAEVVELVEEKEAK